MTRTGAHVHSSTCHEQRKYAVNANHMGEEWDALLLAPCCLMIVSAHEYDAHTYLKW